MGVLGESVGQVKCYKIEQLSTIISHALAFYHSDSIHSDEVYRFCTLLYLGMFSPFLRF